MDTGYSITNRIVVPHCMPAKPTANIGRPKQNTKNDKMDCHCSKITGYEKWHYGQFKVCKWKATLFSKQKIELNIFCKKEILAFLTQNPLNNFLSFKYEDVMCR